MKKLLMIILLASGGVYLFAQTGTITNISVQPRTDGSGMIDVHFDLSGEAASYNVLMEVSFDAGNTYTPIPTTYLSGDLQGVSPGSRHVVWDGYGSFPGEYSEDARVKVMASIHEGFGSLTEGLISYWKFDGDLTDANGNNDGTAASGITTLNEQGVINQSPYFNGSSNAYISCGNDQSLNITGTAISMSAWVFNEKTSGIGDVISKGRDYTSNYGYHLRWYNSNNSVQAIYRLSNNLNNTVGVIGLNLNEWYHIVSTFDGVNGKIYINGQLENTTEQAGSIGNATTQFIIGAHSAGPTGWGYQWKGRIDEVGIWNRVLSPEEINGLYKNGNGLQYPF